MKHYTLAVDPPWNEQGGGKIKRGADRHYPLLKSNNAIVDALFGSVLWPEIEKGDTASLFLWATANFLDDAIRLCGMLGFEYVTNAVWVKAEMHTISGDGFFSADPPMAFEVMGDVAWAQVVRPQAPGLGQRFRMCHEHLLYARAGKVPSPPPDHRMPSVIYAPRTKHSAKPQEAYDVIEMHEHGVGLALAMRGEPDMREFFARARRPGWEVWGNEVDHD